MKSFLFDIWLIAAFGLPVLFSFCIGIPWYIAFLPLAALLVFPVAVMIVGIELSSVFARILRTRNGKEKDE